MNVGIMTKAVEAMKIDDFARVSSKAISDCILRWSALSFATITAHPSTFVTGPLGMTFNPDRAIFCDPTMTSATMRADIVLHHNRSEGRIPVRLPVIVEATIIAGRIRYLSVVTASEAKLRHAA